MIVLRWHLNNPSNLWFAVRVKSRFEVAVSKALRSRGFEEFLPTFTARRQWSDRIRVSQKPLFPGYLFCRFEPANRAAVLAIPGVVLLVGQGKTPLPIDAREIESIRLAVTSGLRVEPWSRLQIGNTVRIERGPLSGVQGVLLRFKGANHLILTVQLLQRGVAVELDESWVVASKPGLQLPTIPIFSPEGSPRHVQ
jgi:transcription antitermination factor NusG